MPSSTSYYVLVYLPSGRALGVFPTEDQAWKLMDKLNDYTGSIPEEFRLNEVLFEPIAEELVYVEFGDGKVKPEYEHPNETRSRMRVKELRDKRLAKNDT